MKLWVSLPKNDLSLAQAALRGGAELVKVHLNAHHRASGTVFGTFTEERPFLEELAKLPTRKAVMIGQETLPSHAELRLLKEWGFEAFNLYLHHLKPGLADSGLRPVLALGHGYTNADLELVRSTPNAWVEASVVDPAHYGQPLTAEDLAHYREIKQKTGRTVIVPSQKKILASDIAALAEAGVDVVLIGVIVMGSTPESVEAAARELSRECAKFE